MVLVVIGHARTGEGRWREEIKLMVPGEGGCGVGRMVWKVLLWGCREGRGICAPGGVVDEYAQESSMGLPKNLPAVN